MRGRRTSRSEGWRHRCWRRGGRAGARSGDDGNKTEDAILSDAAKRLGVSADELESALAQAGGRPARPGREGRRPDQGAGRRDQEAPQGSAGCSGVPAGPMGGPGFGGPRGSTTSAGPASAAPAACSTRWPTSSASRWRSSSRELRDGKTLAQVAKAHDKSLDDLKEAASACSPSASTRR